MSCPVWVIFGILALVGFNIQMTIMYLSARRQAEEESKRELADA